VGGSEITRVKHGITFLILCCFKYKDVKRLKSGEAEVNVLEKDSSYSLLLFYVERERERESGNGRMTVMPALYVFSAAGMSLLFLRFTPRNCYMNFRISIEQTRR
jgi:hypothetical protein